MHEGDHNLSGFQAKEITSNPAEHIEQEAPQTLLGPRLSIGISDNMTSIAFLSKGTLGLLLAPRGELIFPAFSS